MDYIICKSKAKNEYINNQGSKGIRQCPINWFTSPRDTRKYPFCIVQLVAEAFGHST